MTMDILFVSPEVYPFARAGGLGDVSHYLPLALAQRGHRLWVITPKYRQTESAGHDLEPLDCSIMVPLSWQGKEAKGFRARTAENVEVIFVGCDDLFNRNGLYGNEYGNYEDNAERFIFFSRAVLEFIKALDLHPTLIHCHDWPSGLVPVYAKTLYADLPNLENTATLFSFHNLGSQGVFWHYDYAMTGLGWELFHPEGLEFHGQFNMTKAGLVYADHISTVSRRYAEEVLTPEFAFGLEGVLQARRASTSAVLNGVNYKVWDPAADPLLAAPYSPENLDGKQLCRDELSQIFNLEKDDRPIAAVISRLLDRKGFDLIGAAASRLLALDTKIVFMGMGEDKYHALLSDLTDGHPGRVGSKVAYDKDLAHKIMAGADIFLMPSRYEPCGLEQLYGLKYGTIPVVRATGGLDDTIIDVRTSPETGTGFKFIDYTPEAMLEAIGAAVDLFRDREKWKELMRRGMAGDFSWDKAAAEYEKIYKMVVEKASRS